MNYKVNGLEPQYQTTYQRLMYPNTRLMKCLGKEFQIAVGNARDIALINHLGIEYYNELKQTGFSLDNKELEEFLDNQYLAFIRDKKINEILK